MIPAESLTCHPEVLVPVLGIFVGTVRVPPVDQSLLTGSFKLIPTAFFKMLGSVATETVDTEIFHPSGKPVDEIVGRSTLAACTPAFEIWKTIQVVIAAFFSSPFLLEERRYVDRCGAFGDNVGQTCQRLGVIIAPFGCITGTCSPAAVTEGAYPWTPPVAPVALFVGIE